MRYLLLFFCTCFFLAEGSGQNLIQNGDLEDTIPRLFGYKFAEYWNSPTGASPDYMSKYHNNFDNNFGAPINLIGYQIPKSDKSYLGFESISVGSAESREYIQNKLESELKKDSSYCIQFYISLADSSRLATRNSLGVFFSDYSIDSNTRVSLSLSPQLILDSSYLIDKEQWVLVQGTYKANGGEEYITIGNFNSDINTDTLQLSNGGNELFMNAAYYYVDNFYLGHCDSIPEDTAIGLAENRLKEEIQLYPNPTSNRVQIKYTGGRKIQYQLFNRMGKELAISSILKSANTFIIDLSNQAKGIYFLNISDGENRITKKLIKK